MSPDAYASRLAWAGAALGFALGGFFDGILLHQILQWHHLLSAIEGDLAFQVVADGLFHAAMYAIAALGLALLWRARTGFAAPGAETWTLAFALIGFGAWHVADALLSHWLLGIHRIRMDATNPLLWDLGWLALFGLAPLAAGLLTLRRGGGSGTPRRRAPAMLSLVVLAAGPLAALPPPGGAVALAVFRPGTSLPAVLDAAEAAGGQVVWADGTARLWAIALGPDGHAGRLYREGAIMVASGPFAAGCLAFARP